MKYCIFTQYRLVVFFECILPKVFLLSKINFIFNEYDTSQPRIICRALQS